jgi:hypothetical protein
MMEKVLSRKFVVTILIMIASVVVPLMYKKAGVSDSIVMAVLALLGGVGVAYKVVNVMEHKADLNAPDSSKNP